MNVEHKRLHRSTNESMLFGVAGGMAEYFDVDPTLVRIAWVVLTFASAGIALIAYLILAIIMPKHALPQHARTSTAEVSAESSEPEYDAPPAEQRWGRGRTLLGGVLVVMGVLFLLNSLGALYWWRWDIFWPVVIIAVGVAILASRMAGRDDG